MVASDDSKHTYEIRRECEKQLYLTVKICYNQIIQGIRFPAERRKMEKKTTVDTIWDNLGISNDFMFGKIMQNPRLCKELLQRILPELEIDRVEYPEAQKSIRPDADAKSVRLDVYVSDDKGTVYDIEMQMTDTKELPKRTRYYQSMIDLQLIDRGEYFKNLKPVYIIFICLFDLFGKGRHIYTFQNVCKEDKDIVLEDGTTKIFLNTAGDRNDVSNELRVFLEYVSGKKSDDSFIRELEEAVEEARKNRKWRHEYMTLLMREQESEERGLEKGILGMIASLRKFGVSDDSILQELEDKFTLSEPEAKDYMMKSEI